MPVVPADVARHRCLVYSSVQGDDRWQFGGAAADESTLPEAVRVQGPLRSNNLSALLDAARAGMGLAILPWYVAHDAVAAGTVVPLLVDYPLPVQEMHAVFPSPKLVPSKVTSFIGFLQEQFTPQWWEVRR